MSRIHEADNGEVSVLNSTSIILPADTGGSDHIFTGQSEDVEQFVETRIAVFSDVASATDGLSIEYSTDGTNWDHCDVYSVPAGTGKNYVVQRVAKNFRVVYANGTVGQAEFRLSTIFNRTAGVPSSHRLGDDINSDDDAPIVAAVLKVEGAEPNIFTNVGVNQPLPVDGDQIYTKDIELSESSLSAGWTGSVLDLFNDRFSTITNTTSNNPKTVTVRFQRPVQTNILGFATNAGDFSNSKIIGLLEPLATFTIVDESADATVKVALIPDIQPTTINGFTLEFHTANAVSLSTVTVSKAHQRISRLQAIQPDGTVVNIGATDSGNMKVTDAENGLAIAKGEVEGSTFIHKFGAAGDFDPGDGFVTVWDGAESGAPYAKMVYTYSTTDDIDTLSSDDAGNTQLTEVQGLDINYDLVVQSKALNGLNPVTLDTPLIRVFRVKNINSVDYGGHVFTSVAGTLTAGVPTPANVRAVVHGENNQTEMAVYTIPAGKAGYMRDWYSSTAGAKRDSSHVINVLARPFGEVFQLKHKAAIVESGTSYIKHNYAEPEVFAEKTDIEIRMNTDQDTAAVSAGFDIVLVDN